MFEDREKPTAKTEDRPEPPRDSAKKPDDETETQDFRFRDWAQI